MLPKARPPAVLASLMEKDPKLTAVQSVSPMLAISPSASDSQANLANNRDTTHSKSASVLWPFTWACFFFLFLWAMDFPKPYFDDLFYNGAALNLAQGGDFSNPLLARQGFPNHFFFVYPPLHSYAVYGWLSLFGISSASMLGFQNTMHLIIAAAMILILKRHNSPAIFSWLAPLGVAAVFLKPGLRPEALAVALTMAGYTLLTYCRTAGLRCWIAFVLMSLGASAAPRTAPFSAALAAMGAWEWMRSAPENKSSRLRLCVLAGLALAVAGVVFLALIQFQLREFMETFHLHYTRLEHGTLRLLYRYLRDLEPGVIGILWLAIVVLCASLQGPVDELSRVCYCLAGVLAFMAFTGALGHGSSWYVVFILFLMAGSLVKRIPAVWGTLLRWTVVFLLLMANSAALIGAFGQLTGKVEQRPPENLETIRQFRSTAEHPLVLDVAVARYAFDYRLPVGCFDFEFAAHFPAYTATDIKPRDGDIFLLSPGTALGINGKGNCFYTIEWWNVPGLENWSQLKYPHQVYVIPARDLLRTKTAAQTADMSGPSNPQ
jgi:hypothetical protein